ncbi:MAG: hypothetical protein HGB19_11205 [Chlorobiales bacterium]|nr:hypothetical protein [Chlorobiales bacterium]
MGINLILSRGTTVDFTSLPPNSIALDGYVQGPAIDLRQNKFSFDHHAGCIRHVTSATCKQVLDALLLGFEPNGMKVYINDVDGDTALAVWLLLHPNKAQDLNVRELVETVAAMDALGPAYPALNPQLGKMFHKGAMLAEREARKNKSYATCDLEELLHTCLNGIDRLLSGERFPLPPESEQRYTITHYGNGFVMVRTDENVFDLLYREGITCGVMYQKQPDGSVAYTIAKKSEFVPHFPVGPHTEEGTILHALSEQEPGWGGGTTVGGAPRNMDGSRSRLSPDDVFTIINDLIARFKKDFS